MRKNDLAFNLVAVPVDFILLIAAAFAAYFLRVSGFIAEVRPVRFYLTFSSYFSLALGFSFFLSILFALSGLYTIRRSTPIVQEIVRILIATSAGMALAIVFMFFKLAWFDSRFIFLVAWVFVVTFVSVGRILLRLTRVLLLRHKGIGAENLLILGSGKEARAIEEHIKINKHLDVRLVDVVETPDMDTIRDLHIAKKLDRVLVVNDSFDRKEIMRVVNFCEENGIEFSYVPDMFGAIIADMSFDILEGYPIVSVRPSPLDGWGHVAKRITDIALASFLLIVFSPLFLFFALIIKWDTDGPVFVRLTRISHGKEFGLFKFRSMIKDAEKHKQELLELNERKGSPLFKLKDDPRVTRIGRFLRSHRYDELPQLFNVIKGDISLVGPRPHEPKEIQEYQDYHKKVLAVKAGITGLAQVNGASDLTFDEEVKFDRFYLENWSLRQDIAILFKTLKLFLFDRSGV